MEFNQQRTDTIYIRKQTVETMKIETNKEICP